MDAADFIEWEKKAPGIDFKVQYVDICRDHTAGFLLSQIIYWSMPGKDSATKLRVMREGELWIAKTEKQWWEETRLTRKRFKRALLILKKENLVYHRRFMFQNSPTHHIRLNVAVFLEKMQAVLSDPVLPLWED